MVATPGGSDKCRKKLAERKLWGPNWPGRSRHNAIDVTGPVRSSDAPATSLSRVVRRLSRLADSIKQTRIGNGTVALDFRLFQPPPRRRKGDSDVSQVRERINIPTGGASSQSVAIVRTDRENLIVSRYAVRLSPPDRSRFPETREGRKEAVFAVRDLVGEIRPPTKGTKTWVRPKVDDTPLAGLTSSRQKRFLNRTHPHVGAFGISAHPTVFLNFVADLDDAYPEQLN